MTEMYFHVVINNSTILTNLPKELISEVSQCPQKTQVILCPIRHLQKRQKKYHIENGFIYLCSYDATMTKKTFAFYFDAFLGFYNAFTKKLEEIENKKIQSSRNDIHRLQHNVNSYNAKIQDDLNDLIPIEEKELDQWQQIVKYAKQVVQSKPKETAIVLLKTMKNISLVNAEMNVYDYIENPTGKIKLLEHQIHKVIKLSLQPFFLDFLENGIKPIIHECREIVKIDYSSISVALGHIWSNAIKYTSRGTDIDISFECDNNYLNICFEMYSIAIDEDEYEQIFKEGYSGKWVKSKHAEGKGIGMHYIKYLTELNGGTFTISPGVPNSRINGIPYADNKFILKLQRQIKL